MKKAYHLTTKDLTGDIEVDFNKLSKETSNFIIDYNVSNNKYFKRTLFELDRLKLNTGILIVFDDKNEFTNDTILKYLINDIRGFKINLGIWVDYTNIENLELYNLLENYQEYFITGIRDINNKCTISNSVPLWSNNGDIIEQDNTKEITLISDYKTIYEENKMKPIPSNYII